MNKSKKISRIITAALVLVITAVLFPVTGQLSRTVAYAAEIVSVSDEGEIVSDDVYVCGCCHSHQHTDDFIGRFSCFFCKFSMFLRNLFGEGEKDAVHKYIVTDEIPATCKNPGYAEYLCIVCGVTNDAHTAKLSHITEKIPVKLPTCTLNGTTGGFRCILCEEELIEPDVLYAVGHSFGEYISDNNADCTKDGTKTATCYKCGETKSVTEYGTKKEHSVYVVEAKSPDCENPGWEPYEKCDNCSYSSCVEIPSLGHKPVTVKGFTGDCENDGLTDGAYCGVCKKILTEQKVIPASGHDFNDGDTVSDLVVNITGTDVVTADYRCCKCNTVIENGEIDAAASVGGYNKVYHTLEKAIKAAKNTNVYLLRDYTLRENITIGNGVTLVIPCMAGDMGYIVRNDDGFYSRYCPDNMNMYPDKRLYRVFVVPSGKTITVDNGGTLLVNAVTGLNGGGQPYSYGISGNFAEMKLGGTVNVEKGGVFDCSGYTNDDGGSVTLSSGAKMCVTYGIVHWRGGSYAFAAKAKKVYPIDGYEMNNMRAKVIMNYGANLLGTCKMVAGEAYQYCHFKVAGSEDGYLYQLNPGARMENTVEKDTGKLVTKFYGNIKIGIASIDVGMTNFKTSGFEAYKVDGNSRMEFYDGTVTTNQKVMYMPGAVLIVGKGATLNITGSVLGKGKMLFCTADDYVYNGTTYKGYCNIDSRFIGAEGVHCRNDLGDAALYVVDGGRVNVGGYGASLAGKVYIDDKSAVTFNEDSEKSVTVKVAVGEVKGASVLASVSTEKYTIPYIQLPVE